VLIAAIRRKRGERRGVKSMEKRIIRGVNFCHVRSIDALIQGRAAMVDGNH